MHVNADGRPIAVHYSEAARRQLDAAPETPSDS
jgi:hypothetical protein